MSSVTQAISAIAEYILLRPQAPLLRLGKLQYSITPHSHRHDPGKEPSGELSLSTGLFEIANDTSPRFLGPEAGCLTSHWPRPMLLPPRRVYQAASRDDPLQLGVRIRAPRASRPLGAPPPQTAQQRGRRVAVEGPERLRGDVFGGSARLAFSRRQGHVLRGEAWILSKAEQGDVHSMGCTL